MEDRSKMGAGNPEALHDVGQTTAQQVSPKFVNPGTPAAPLVSMADMTSANVGGKGASRILEANIVK